MTGRVRQRIRALVERKATDAEAELLAAIIAGEFVEVRARGELRGWIRLHGIARRAGLAILFHLDGAAGGELELRLEEWRGVDLEERARVVFRADDVDVEDLERIRGFVALPARGPGSSLVTLQLSDESR